MKPHIFNEKCWCKPICIFDATKLFGEDYGRVFVHSDMEDDLVHDPGPEAISAAVSYALEEKEEVHISDQEYLFENGIQN